MKLTEKQKRFCDFYIETGNATEATRRAGYKGKNLNRVASENLSKLDIQRYIDERNVKIEEERIANIKEVKMFWTSIMRNKAAEMKDRLKASEFIAKTNAAFTERFEHKENGKDENELEKQLEYQRILEQDPELQNLYIQIWQREQMLQESK